MTMTPRLRRLALVGHVTFSVGWLGAVVAYLVLAVMGRTTPDAQLARAAYLAMEVLGWGVIVPFSLAALVSGLLQSWGTSWGLFRYYWVLVKFGLTTLGTLVLLLHMRNVSGMAGVAAGMTLSPADFGSQRLQLVVHAAGGLLVLLAATVLSVYKPWGKTAYGRRSAEKPVGRQLVASAAGTVPAQQLTSALPVAASWGGYLKYVVIGLLLLFALLHLSKGGMNGLHGR
jgi:hypothetical protein